MDPNLENYPYGGLKQLPILFGEAPEYIILV